MYKTIDQIKKLRFPLYALPSNNFDVIDNICFVDGAPVDDLNMKGESIGIRRRQSKRKDLYKLRNPKFCIKDVINSKQKFFISSCGQMFQYEKTRFENIIFHGIKRIELRNTYSFLYISDYDIPFEIPRPPTDYESTPWVRMLYYGDFPWLVYEYAKLKGRNTRIKV